MMSFSAQATSNGALNGETSAFNVKDDSYMDLDLVYRAKYLITSNFLANFHYGISNDGVFDRTVATNPTSEIKRHENFFGIGAEFLF
jgi:hypothetical protein